MAYLSWYEVVIFLTVPLLFVWVVLGHLTHTGMVESVSDGGFVLRNLVGFRLSVAWSELAPQVQEFKESLPRLVFRVNRSFLAWPSRVVLLRGRPAEAAFTSAARDRLQVRQSRLETFTGRKRVG